MNLLPGYRILGPDEIIRDTDTYWLYRKLNDEVLTKINETLPYNRTMDLAIPYAGRSAGAFPHIKFIRKEKNARRRNINSKQTTCPRGSKQM